MYESGTAAQKRERGSSEGVAKPLFSSKGPDLPVSRRSSRLTPETRIGLALSGGSVRGLAHIGVIKALSEAGISPAIVAGTSAGSVVGAAYAAGYCWRGIAELASSAFWPSLLVGARLEQFCSRHLPEDFNELELDFSAVATLLPSRQPLSIREGRLASAINASCALRVVRRSVFREGRRLKDGGIACVLPARVCREMGAEFSSGLCRTKSRFAPSGTPLPGPLPIGPGRNRPADTAQAAVTRLFANSSRLGAHDCRG